MKNYTISTQTDKIYIWVTYLGKKISSKLWKWKGDATKALFKKEKSINIQYFHSFEGKRKIITILKKKKKNIGILNRCLHIVGLKFKYNPKEKEIIGPYNIF